MLSSDKSLQDRNHKCEGFPGACDSFNYNIFMFHKERDGGSLHWCHLGVTHRLYYIVAGLGMRIRSSGKASSRLTSRESVMLAKTTMILQMQSSLT